MSDASLFHKKCAHATLQNIYPTAFGPPPPGLGCRDVWMSGCLVVWQSKKLHLGGIFWHLGGILGLVGGILGQVGGILRHLGGILGHLGGILGASWCFSKNIEKTLVFTAFLKHFGGILGPLGGILEASWGLLEASWGLLEASWGILEASWGILEASWGQLGPLGSIFGTLDPKSNLRSKKVRNWTSKVEKTLVFTSFLSDYP